MNKLGLLDVCSKNTPFIVYCAGLSCRFIWCTSIMLFWSVVVFQSNCFLSAEATIKSQSCHSSTSDWQGYIILLRTHMHVHQLPLCARSLSLLFLSIPLFLFHLALFLSLSFSISFSPHQAVERQIRSWFTIQLNVVIETLLQKSLSFSPCANWPSTSMCVC